MSRDFMLQHFNDKVGICINNIKECIQPALRQQCIGRGDISLAHFGPLSANLELSNAWWQNLTNYDLHSHQI